MAQPQGVAKSLQINTPTADTRTWLAWLEFALITAVYLADWKHLVVPSKVPYLFLLAWISLRLRGLRWRNVGFSIYRNWWTTLLIGLAAGAGIEALELFGTQPLIARITGHMPDLSAFDRVAGNVKWLALSLALSWTLFAFGEELVFRGYLMNRIAGLAGETRAAWTAALLLANAVFGLSHWHQGTTGVIENVIDGVILGILYLRFGRSLAIPIVAHGITDTLDFLLLYLRHYPGMH